jgi:hypothetical protein
MKSGKLKVTRSAEQAVTRYQLPRTNGFSVRLPG